MTFEEWRHYEFGAQADEQGRFEISMLAAAWQASRQQAIKECAAAARTYLNVPEGMPRSLAIVGVGNGIAEAIERIEI